ncbi:isoleucyl-tRNA synthetase [mine drainage metagenome]|uniref:Isoleucyl-tRNA synthetase n=1 Tax=mine drainage metagenome TaxID=410659 RepID=T0ZXN2_9ZZZZ
MHNFCSVELGSFYLDVLKDRMYTLPAGSRARRSAQTAMYHLAECMVRWLAPILSFTAEEIWTFLAGGARRVGVPEHLARSAAGPGRRDRLAGSAAAAR